MTNKYKIAIIPGDGIGSEVMDATISVLNELDIDFEYIYGDAGDECLEKNGDALPEKTIEIVRNSDACLFGAAGESAAEQAAADGTAIGQESEAADESVSEEAATDTKDEKEQEWYYRSVAEVLSELSDLPQYREYIKMLDEVFGERH